MDKKNFSQLCPFFFLYKKIWSNILFYLLISIIMNTTFLQEKENQEYQNFFNAHDLVLSLPLPFILSWKSYKYNGKWTSLWWKIPLRLYIWINQKSTNKKQIPFYYKTNSKEKFKKSYLEYFYFIDKILLQEIWFSYDISFLAEYNNFEVEHFLALIFFAQQLIENKREKKDIQDCRLAHPNTSKIFNGLNNFFSKHKESLAFCFKNNYPNLWSLAISIVQSDTFLLFEKNKNIFFKELWKWKHYYNNGINYYIINKNFPNILNSTHNKIKEKNTEITIFSKQEKLQYQNDIHKGCEGIEKHFAYEMTKNLQEMYLNISNGKKIFNNIESYQRIYQNLIHRNNNDNIDSNNYKKLFHKHLPYTSNPNYISLIFWKNIEVYSHKFIHFDNYQIRKINQEENLQLSLDFASDQDWFEIQWLQLEQWKEQKQYSHFCSEYKIKTFIKNKISEESIDYNIAIKKNDWLLLDTITNKIYLLWKKLNSKEIRSQSWTIELFKVLLDDNNIGNEIYNSDLPSSSYSKNKNEMLSKIILPLRNVINKKTGKDIKLDCHGSLVNFALKLKNSNIKIHFLEKIE